MTGGFVLPPLRAIVAIHAESLAEHGGAPGLRDVGGLEACLARPHQMAACAETPPDIFAVATALCAGICRIHHPFIDGNKRAALASLGIVLMMNGLYLDAREQEAADRITSLSAGDLDEEGFAAWIRQFSLQSLPA